MVLHTLIAVATDCLFPVLIFGPTHAPPSTLAATLRASGTSGGDPAPDPRTDLYMMNQARGRAATVASPFKHTLLEGTATSTLDHLTRVPAAIPTIHPPCAVFDMFYLVPRLNVC